MYKFPSFALFKLLRINSPKVGTKSGFLCCEHIPENKGEITANSVPAMRSSSLPQSAEKGTGLAGPSDCWRVEPRRPTSQCCLMDLLRIAFLWTQGLDLHL